MANSEGERRREGGEEARTSCKRPPLKNSPGRCKGSQGERRRGKGGKGGESSAPPKKSQTDPPACPPARHPLAVQAHPPPSPSTQQKGDWLGWGGGSCLQQDLPAPCQKSERPSPKPASEDRPPPLVSPPGSSYLLRAGALAASSWAWRRSQAAAGSSGGGWRGRQWRGGGGGCGAVRRGGRPLAPG